MGKNEREKAKIERQFGGNVKVEDNEDFTNDENSSVLFYTIDGNCKKQSVFQKLKDKFSKSNSQVESNGEEQTTKNDETRVRDNFER